MRKLALITALVACGGAPDAPVACGAEAIPIHLIQGSGDESPWLDQTVSVAGVVTAHANHAGSAGFFVQELQPDALAETSEGLWIAGGHHAPEIGARVHVRGRVSEHEGVTQLDRVELIQDCGQRAARPPRIRLGAEVELEQLESMWVRLVGEWTLTDTSALMHRSMLGVSRGGRAFASGHVLGSGTSAQAWRVVDADSGWARAIDAGGESNWRLGSRGSELVGIVLGAGGSPQLLATELAPWQGEPPRAPARKPGELRVAALNLRNYFLTLGLRGAASEAELLRQEAKLVALLAALDADVLALCELENSAASLERLGAKLNAALAPPQRYAWSTTPAPGRAVLRAALLFRAERVTPLGAAWFEPSASFRRAPVFQRFDLGGLRVTVGAVHFPSKRCDGAVAEAFEGCGAAERLAEARELVRVAERISSARGDELLLLGDFNADALEPPLAELARAGFHDLLAAVAPEQRYSYVHDGRATQLDHALATAGLARALRGAALWHVNADEPSFKGYELYNPEAQYAPDWRRSSDHDPIIVDLAPRTHAASPEPPR